jgi:hypothetical protein
MARHYYLNSLRIANYGIAKAKWFAQYHLPSKEDHLSIDIGYRKKFMLA